MTALPAIRTAANIAALGLDHRPYLRATDEAERMAEIAVARRLAARRDQEAREAGV